MKTRTKISLKVGDEIHVDTIVSLLQKFEMSLEGKDGDNSDIRVCTRDVKLEISITYEE